MTNQRLLTYLISGTIVLTLVVIILGAYTRLTDAGLGCPDWPGCYGQMVIPHSTTQQITMQDRFPETLLDTRKAWTEMIHRYVAGTLGLSILIIFLVTVRRYYKQQPVPVMGATLLLGLVIFQALLGKWTVTQQLHPIIVMAHLLGGMLILAGLTWLFMRCVHPTQNTTSYPKWILGGWLILFGQIALGGWVSANYAGVACTGFPLCNGQLWPNMNFNAAFNPLIPLGINYEFGALDNPSRVAIQMMHRIGAIITALYVGSLSIYIIHHSTNRVFKYTAISILMLLLLQFILGVINVVAILPLVIAVAHNATAALLLSAMTILFYQSYYGKNY